MLRNLIFTRAPSWRPTTAVWIDATINPLMPVVKRMACAQSELIFCTQSVTPPRNAPGSPPLCSFRKYEYTNMTQASSQIPAKRDGPLGLGLRSLPGVLQSYSEFTTNLNCAVVVPG